MPGIVAAVLIANIGLVLTPGAAVRIDSGAAARSFDPVPFASRLHAADLHPGNARRVDLELERK